MRNRILVVLVILLAGLYLQAGQSESLKEAPTEEVEIVEVRLTGDTLVATINIPEKQHMARQEDFVYVEIEPQEGVTLGETEWSEGDFVDELGIINYHHKAVMKRKLTIADDLKKEQLIIRVYVGYQLCFDAYCEPPEEVEVDIILPPEEID